MDRPRVLLVEDDDAVLALFATSVQDTCVVSTATSGEQALEVANDLNYEADVIVVDLALGTGMRGDQFVTEYRRRAPHDVPVIIVSGVPRAYEIARSMRASAMLPKPVDPDDLARTVGLFAHQHRASSDLS